MLNGDRAQLRRQYNRFVFTRCKCDYQFVAMQRSGHHAVMNWLMGMTHSNVLYNNCNRYGVPRNIEGHTGARFRYRNFENAKPENCRFRYKHSILVIRDPKNQFASYRKKFIDELSSARPLLSLPFHTKEHAFVLAQIWKSHAKEALGHTNSLRNKHVIIFDRWYENPGYRMSIAEALGLEFNDSGKQKLAWYGGGSSFEGRARSDNPEMLNVTGRWHEVKDDEIYQSVFKDRELVSLAADMDFDLGPLLWLSSK